jgi:hypothetical protein
VVLNSQFAKEKQAVSAENDAAPQVWSFEKANGGAFAGINNKATAGATHEKELPKRPRISHRCLSRKGQCNRIAGWAALG